MKHNSNNEIEMEGMTGRNERKNKNKHNRKEGEREGRSEKRKRDRIAKGIENRQSVNIAYEAFVFFVHFFFSTTTAHINIFM